MHERQRRRREESDEQAVCSEPRPTKRCTGTTTVEDAALSSQSMHEGQRCTTQPSSELCGLCLSSPPRTARTLHHLTPSSPARSLMHCTSSLRYSSLSSLHRMLLSASLLHCAPQPTPPLPTHLNSLHQPCAAVPALLYSHLTSHPLSSPMSSFARVSRDVFAHVCRFLPLRDKLLELSHWPRPTPRAMRCR